MIKYCVKRILSLIPAIFTISIILFTMVKMMPGDQVALMLNPSLKADAYEAAYKVKEKELGLDQNVVVQYTRWISNMAQGELGYSSIYSAPVSEVIINPLKNTVIMNFFVLIISLSISIYAGICSAMKKGKFTDHFWQVFSLIGKSIPTFFIGLCLIYIFAMKLGFLPTGGMPNHGGPLEWVRYLILPVGTLVIGNLAGTIRYVRNAMLDVLSQDYIRTARSKGLSDKVVVYSHAFRNALVPVVSIVITQIAALFSGSMITEAIFSWDGLGTVLLKALNHRDLYLIVSINMFYVFLYLISNFIADITYALVDPRVKLD